MSAGEELRLFTGAPGDVDGQGISLDGTDIARVSRDDVAEIIHHGLTADDWDGEEVAVLRLKDGRFVAYESWWGPTGDGFSSDAYGGDTNLYFAKDAETLVRLALSDEGRRLCGLPQPGEIPGSCDEFPIKDWGA